MPLPEPIQKFSAQISALVHADRKKEAAHCVADFCKIPLKLDDDDPAKYLPVLQNWLHWLLNNGGVFEAAELLWTPNLFDPRPKFTKDVFKFYEDVSRGLIMGASSCSKSFSVGTRLMLDWIRDPDWTTVRVCGPSKEHLEANLFSSLVRLHKQASLPMPGTESELFLGNSRRNQIGSIKGIVIPLGRLKKSGRLQGTKRERRPKPHPLFGERTRMYIFMDEVENIPEGIWDDVSNLLSQTSPDPANFKILGAYNPKNSGHEVGKRAEPEFGWKDLDPDKHFRWKSKRGWEILRLDGEQSENVIAGKEIYPGIQTREGLEAIANDGGGGRDSANYATQGRGIYPTQGAVAAIIPPGMFEKLRGEFIWMSDPTPVAGCDLALEGGNACKYTIGRLGMASGMKLPADLENPQGRTVMFKDPGGVVVPRYGLQVDQQFSLPKGDSVATARELAGLNRKSGVKPMFFCCDRTGIGSGISDIMRHEWGTELHDVQYSSGPSETKLMAEDTKTCKEEYDRMCSELWYALRAFSEYGYLLLNPSMEVSALQHQCTTRLVKHGSHKSRVESKSDYKSRNSGQSPDDADSLTLFVHAARRGARLILSRLGESVGGESWEDNWYDSGGLYKGGARIDLTNRVDAL